MELQFRSLAIAGLNTFVTNYEEAHVALFQDSGLWGEDVIIEGFRQSSKKLRDDILLHISIRLSGKKVLGRKVVDRDWLEIDFHVSDRLIIVCYTEDPERKIRFIETIAIDRRPIIF